MIKFLVLLSSLFFIVSCGEEDKKSIVYDKIDVVTGLDLFDVNGQEIGRWREPNHRRMDVAVFPVPAIDDIFLSVASGNLQTVWVVSAACAMDESADISTLIQSVSFTTAEISEASVMQLDDLTGNSLRVSMANLTADFYKLFYQKDDGVIGWTNIYVDPTKTNFPDVRFLDVVCPQ